MKNAAVIVMHAVQMLVFNPVNTIRVLLPALAIIILNALLLAFFLPGMAQELLTPDTFSNIEIVSSQQLAALLVSILAMILGYTLLAVLWHRHVLLPDRQKLQPGLDILISYFWRGVLVAILQLLALVPAGAVMGFLFAAIGMTFFVLELAIPVFGFWLVLRISVILPAATVGRKMSISESWAETRAISGTIWCLAILVVLINSVFSLLTVPLLNVTSATTVVLSALTLTLSALIFVSILTTLYGHLVEQRPLG